MKKHSFRFLFSGGIFIVALSFFLSSDVMAAPLAGANSDVGKYWRDEFGFTDGTADANDSDVGGDTPWANVGGGAAKMYIGHATQKFTGIYIETTNGSFGAADLIFEYWDGSTWSSSGVNPVNNTNAFVDPGVHNFSITAPADWATTSVNGEGDTFYYIRITCTDNCQGISPSQISLLTSGGGGGEPVPEFSDIMYIITLILGAYFIYVVVNNKKNMGQV